VGAIFVASTAEAAMVAVEGVPAVAGRGLEGDRYFDGAGTFSAKGGTGRDITLVDAAALAAAGVSEAESRRNVVVSGIDLDALIGRSFRVGELECFGRRRCEPCAHLQRLTRPGVLRALVHRGGLRADVVAGGIVRVGDEVVAI
jgi:MOSC domain-containing protein YiiM